MKGFKTGGRTIGSTNKVTADLRNMVKNIVEENMEQIRQDIATLTPRERVAVIEKLMQYVIPKIQSVELDAQKEVNSAVTLLRELAKYSDGA